MQHETLIVRNLFNSVHNVIKGHGCWAWLSLVPLLLAGGMSTAQAQEWVGGDVSGPTNWFVDGNWVGGSVPDGSSMVVIDTIGLNAPTVADQSTNGPASALGLTVGSSGTGALTVEDGGLVIVEDNAFAIIGGFADSNGTVTVKGVHTGTGHRSTLIAGNQLYVGVFGTGELTVEDGGLVNLDLFISIGTQADGDGTVTVKGVHTGGMVDYRSTLDVEQLDVGFEGTGELAVEDGGLVKATTRATVIGNNANSNGTVTVKGVHTVGTVEYRSTLDVGKGLFVGNRSTGALTVEDGGLVKAVNNANIGTQAGGNGTVTVKGVHTVGTVEYRSTLDVGDELDVGFRGTGELVIEDGGLMNVGSGTVIGRFADGNGTVTVKGVHTGTGHRSTLDVGGNLNVGYQGTGALTVEDGGLVNVDNDGPLTGFTSIDAGTVTVNGVHTDTGHRSTLDAGDQLYVGVSGTGALTIANGGLVKVDQVTVIGGGPDSDGTVNIGAASGDPASAPGILDTPNVLIGAGTGTLVFNHTNETGSYAFAPDITSSGDGTHTILHEAGWTGLTGNGSEFDGTTGIDGGVLSIGGSLGGVVNVNAGGTLAGTGALSGPVNVKSGGTIAPGNSIGTVNVADITFDTGSIYAVEIDAAGNSDLINASGMATINGGTVAVSGTADYNTPYTILTADGGLAGTAEFDALTGLTDTLFVTNALSYDANNVYLSSNLAAFCDFTTTANQAAVACGGLDSLSPTSDLAQAVQALTTAQDVQAAHEALSGEAQSSLKSALLDNSQHRINAVNNRIHAGFSSTNTATQTSTAAFGNGSSPADGDNGFWITGYGAWSDSDATTNTAQMDNDLGGVVFGIDRAASDNWRFGVLGGYSQTDMTQSALLSSGSADTWSLGLYGGAEAGATSISFGGIYNWHSINTARTVSFPGFSEHLVADYNAQSWQLFAEAGHKVHMGRAMLEPFAGISHIGLDTDGYSETGGMAALTASSDTQNTTFTTLGVRSSIQLADRIHTRGMLGWRHAFGDTDPTSVFTISGSNPFTVSGAPIAQDALVTELGLEAGVSDSVLIGAAYNGQYGNGTTAHGFNASLRGRF